MTLNTTVAIRAAGEFTPEELYQFGRKLVETPDHIEARIREADNEFWPGRRSIANPIGIGCCAIWEVHWRADGPFIHQHDEWCSVELGGKWNTSQEDIDSHTEHVRTDPTENGWASIVCEFDTSYSYRGENGESCSDLHARLVTAIGGWLDAKGVEWKWQNEYTGEWSDRFENLDAFGNAHRATGADDWYRNVVMPAIESGGIR